MLPKNNRLRSGVDFNLVTKTGARFTSDNLVIYALPNTSNQNQVGFIVNRAVGGSVSRHLVSRKLRHNFAHQLPNLNTNLKLVVRVLKAQNNYTSEVENLMAKINSKFTKTDKADL
ncbi:MAG: ribonuclease P protein component [Actinobacteria bacterium]|nr:ribonuclease P protein component [Actinomycetota bacterium]